MDWRTENNLLKGIEDIVKTSQKQHAEEIRLLNDQHIEVVHELLKQSQSTQDNHSESIKESQKQLKYALLSFIVAIIALLVSIFSELFRCGIVRFAI